MTIHTKIAQGSAMLLLGAVTAATGGIVSSPALALQEDQFPTCRVALEGTDFSLLQDVRDYNSQCCYVMSEKRWYNDNDILLSTVYSVSDEEAMLTTHCRKPPVVLQSLLAGDGDGDGDGHGDGDNGDGDGDNGDGDGTPTDGGDGDGDGGGTPTRGDGDGDGDDDDGEVILY